MAAKCGLFASCRKEFKSYCNVKEGLFREETHSRERVWAILKAKRSTGYRAVFLLGRGGDFQELGHQLLFDLIVPGVCHLAC